MLKHNELFGPRSVTNDPNYDSYRRGRRIIPIVEHVLETTGIDLKNGDGSRELTQFQEHFKDY